MKVYYDKDANLEIIKEKKITIIGYGSRIGVDSRILI
jgi:ketol-acid reductoisomerase